jgi:hypothetical protein
MAARTCSCVLGLALSGVLGPVVARATEPDATRPDAEMLLDLDLLRDPELMRRRPLLERMRLLEFLRLLEGLRFFESVESAPDASPPAADRRQEVR